MAFTTGPIENIGSQPAPANRVFVKILNRTGNPLTRVARTIRLNRTRQTIQKSAYNVCKC